MYENAPFQPLAPQLSNSDIGLEDLNIRGVASYFNGYVTTLSNALSGKVLPSMLNRHESDNAIKAISSLKRTELEYLTIYVPDYISGNYVDYLFHLHNTLTMLKDIDKELIDPMNKWAIHMATTPGYVHKMLVLPEYNNRAEIYTKKLQGFFNGSAGDNLAERRFYDVYKTGDNLHKVNKVVEEMTTLVGEIVNRKLYAKSAELAKNIKRLTDSKGNENFISDLSVEKSEMVSRLVYQIAKDLELLAITIHLVGVASNAQTETTKKLNKSL
jgi:hypothetical protein